MNNYCQTLTKNMAPEMWKEYFTRKSNVAVWCHIWLNNPSSIYLFKVKNAGREDVLFVCNILKLAKSLSYKIFFNEIDNQKELRLVTDVKYWIKC